MDRSRRERGQALILVVLALVVLLGFAGLVIDIGRVYVAQRQLQQAVDAAALAAGQVLPDSATANTNAVSYSATGKNTHTDLTPSAPTVTFKCLSTLAASNIPCKVDSGSGALGVCKTTGCNAVRVTETASVKTTFLGLFLSSFSSISAGSTAGARGGVSRPLDIVVVLDSTASMNSACGDSVTDESGAVAIAANKSTKIDCAKNGVRLLLSGLLPCSTSFLNCGAAPPVDDVALMTFPEVNNPTSYTHDSTNSYTNIGLDASTISCPGQYQHAPAWYKPTGQSFPGWFLQSSDVSYGGPGSTYLIEGLTNDYKTSDGATTLNPASNIVNAVTWDSCPAGKYPGNEYYGMNSIGGAGTYYVGAISAAQSVINADASRNAQGVIILLSDGDATRDPTGAGSPCQKAIAAAKAAADAGTWVYSIAYGDTDTTSGCSSPANSPPISAFNTMSQIARTPGATAGTDVNDPKKFYCDPKPSGATCNTASSLSQIFQNIVSDLVTASRIYPDDTQ